MRSRNSVFWWSPYVDIDCSDHLSKIENVGDIVGPLLVSAILKRKGISNRTPISQGRLIPGGSVLHYVKEFDVVWGAGINGKIDSEKYNFKGVDVRALRGPLSERVIKIYGGRSFKLYGDPGILASIFWSKFSKNKKVFDVSFIPHMSEPAERINKYRKFYNVIYPVTTIYRYLDMLTKSRRIISSSLHGIVLAESFGIPSVYLTCHSGESPFKYEDYYFGTGRFGYRVAHDIPSALDMDAKVPSLGENQKVLLDSFPYDIFSKKAIVF